MPRRFDKRRKPEDRRNQAQVQNNRSRRRRRETAKRVQHASKLRDQRNKHQIGKRDLGQLHGKPEPVGIVGKPRRKAMHHPWHRDLQCGHEKQQCDDEDRQHFLGETAGSILPADGHMPGKERHKGGVECALGKQPAEKIRQLERDEKRICDRARTQCCGNQDVADEPEQTADHRVTADGSNGPEKRHGRVYFSSSGDAGDAEAINVWSECGRAMAWPIRPPLLLRPQTRYRRPVPASQPASRRESGPACFHG